MERGWWVGYAKWVVGGVCNEGGRVGREVWVMFNYLITNPIRYNSSYQTEFIRGKVEIV